ncbi:hypothetical protein [Streptacidiphilus jiangxiensis]|uniref:Uncharacterized protein n=1 Tax=Streptacidiphilus jiangxiensis TaxID=235985 RepID=A0A1H8AM45_STRJI|nr:hypothetical protein [Streptacidiphilus jiangxiensis]SEM71576.1 hypothetical protein SAMN05414137_1478 [Streptacidiphilus jiangxiensis]
MQTPRRGARFWVGLAVAVAVGGTVMAGGGWWVDYRLVDHTWAFWAPPLDLPYCGRDFVLSDTLPAVPEGGFTKPVYRAGYGDWQVYEHSFDPADAAPGCPTDGPPGGLYLVRDQHEVDEYVLSGGP